MITHYLGDQEVTAYAKDFAARLAQLDDQHFPKVWCPIGKSGDKLVRVIAPILKQLAPKKYSEVMVVQINFNKQTRIVEIDPSAIAAGASTANLAMNNVLVLDSSIHSGQSMLAAVRYARQHNAINAISYSLTVKKSSSFLPHYFGVLVGDHDRVLFQLESIPNNRFFTSKYNPLGCFRRIRSEDAEHKRQSLDTGVASIDKISLGDLCYEHQANGYDVILVEDGENIAGFLKIKAHPRKQLQLDVIAADKSYRGKGIGGALMRFAETIGRANCCSNIELWSIEDQISFYEKFGFESTQERINAGGGEIYGLMRKKLLYHFDLNDGDD